MWDQSLTEVIRCGNDTARAGGGCAREFRFGRGADLAAHARVDHGKESRRNLDERYPPHEGRSDVSSQVAHDAATEGDAAGISIHFVLQRENWEFEQNFDILSCDFKRNVFDWLKTCSIKSSISSFTRRLLVVSPGGTIFT